MKRLLFIAATAISIAACSKHKQAESPSSGDVSPTGVSTYDTSTSGTSASRPSRSTSADTTWGSPGTGAGTTGSMTGSGTSGSATGSGTNGSMTGSGATGSTPGSDTSGSSSSMTPAPTDTATPPPSGTAGQSPGATPGSPSADNTGVNKRDRDAAAQTPMNQGTSASDRKVTQQIRKAVVADKSLSFTAKNVKIITNNGHVVLRGVVKSDQERAAIEAAAKKVAGDARVDNQIEVKK